ncbi:MAG TPA: hypothetical protein VGJ94_10655 [Syntrophorhabdaceae bacterium]
MARRRSLLSALGSVVPIPFTDVATDIVLLKQIIPKISEKFGLSKEQIDEYNPQTKILVYDLSKRLGAKMIGRYVTREMIFQILKKLGVRITTKGVVKYIPLIGQIVSAGISYTAMRLIVNSHIKECYKVAQAVLESKGRRD